MKTEVIMSRKLFNGEVRQKHKTEFLSATDLVKAGNQWRSENGLSNFNLSQWLKSQSTKEFVNSLEAVIGRKAFTNTRGRNGGVWVHPYLFIDLALAISPTLKVEVYTWLNDHLLKYRDDSGESYKRMTKALSDRMNDADKFRRFLIPLAVRIKRKIGVSDWDKATEKQLKEREDLHIQIETVAKYARNPNSAINELLNEV